LNAAFAFVFHDSKLTVTEVRVKFLSDYRRRACALDHDGI
jgi:hypothetical protein